MKEKENAAENNKAYEEELKETFKVLDDLGKQEERKRKLSSEQKRSILIQTAVWVMAVVALFFVARDLIRYITVSNRVDELVESGSLEEALELISAQDRRMYARLEKQRYDIAVIYYDRGEYGRALELFQTVTAYGDLSRYIASCKEKLNSQTN